MLRDEVDEGESASFGELVDNMEVSRYSAGSHREFLSDMDENFKKIEDQDPSDRKEDDNSRKIAFGAMDSVYQLYSEEVKTKAKRAKYKGIEKLEKETYEKIKPYVERFNKLGFGNINHEDHKVFVTKLDPDKHFVEDNENMGKRYSKVILDIVEPGISGHQLAKVIVGR